MPVEGAPKVAFAVCPSLWIWGPSDHRTPALRCPCVNERSAAAQMHTGLACFPLSLAELPPAAHADKEDSEVNRNLIVESRCLAVSSTAPECTVSASGSSAA